MITELSLAPALRGTVIVLLASAACACGVLPGKSSQEAVRSYVLSAGLQPGADEADAGNSDSCVSVQVLLPRSAPGFNTARMAYLREPDRVEYFARNQWVDTPAYMLQPLLVKALARSGRFAHVVMAPSTIGKRFRLETDDLALVQRFEGNVSSVRLALRVRLVDSASGTFVFDKFIALDKAAARADPVAGVRTANQLAQELMQRTTAAAQAAVDLSVLCGR